MIQSQWPVWLERLQQMQGTLWLSMVLAAIASVLVLIIFRRIARHHPWLHACTALPLQGLIWGSAGIVMVTTLLAKPAGFAFRLLLVAVVVMILIKATAGLKKQLFQGSSGTADRLLILQLTRGLDCVVLAVCAALVLPVLGIPALAAVLLLVPVLLGSLWLSRDVLANVVSGLEMRRSALLRRGDRIALADPAVEAVVEQLGLTHIGLRTEQSELLWLPNALLSKQWMINASPISQRRIHVHLGVRFEDIDILREIVDETERLLRGHDDVLQDEQLVVAFDRFSVSSADILVSCFVSSVEPELYHSSRQDILLQVHDVIAGHGAELARPSRVVNVDANIRKLRGFGENMVA